MTTKDSTNFHPLVSIIIPVYNGSNYLREAIDSALAQTYDNIEVLVINDGSNDHGATEKIAKSYGKKIRYYAKQNGGVATALNLGIEKMKGEYFSWLSHDDLYYPYKIERQIEYLAKLPSKEVFLYANYALLRGQKLTPVELDHDMLEEKPKYSLLRGAVNGITILVPKKMLESVGDFDLALKCTQDYDLWRKIQKKFPFVHMDEVVSMTRIHSRQDSLSPSALTEGNALWVDMIDSFPDEEKIAYEGTIYNYYCEMVEFLKNTPYVDAKRHCQKIIDNLDKSSDWDGLDAKVSVIIPFYNRTEETMRAMKSVLAQSHKNIEVLLVDDKSTEDISSIRLLAKKDKRVTLIHMPENSGPASARNVGMKAARGEYIAFLDSDDEYLEDKVKTQLLAMVKRNPNISHMAYVRRSSSGESVVQEKWLSGFVRPRIASNCPIATPTVMMSKRFIEKNSLYFREDLRIGEDTCMWLEAVKQSDILFVDSPLTVVNVSDESHAIDANKKSIGLKNVLSYEIADPYYGRRPRELAKLAKAFSDASEDARRVGRKQLSYKGLRLTNPLSRQERFLSSMRDTIPYRAARMMRREGVRGVARATVKNIRGEE